MRWLGDRLVRLRWLAVPFAAYVLVTLALPLANGAAVRGDFARHAGWVVGGCVAVMAIVLAGGVAVDLAAVALGRFGRLPAGSGDDGTGKDGGNSRPSPGVHQTGGRA
jgi:hypothetical protein